MSKFFWPEAPLEVEPVSALEGMAFVFGALFALACVRWWPVLFAIVGAAG